MLVTVVTRDTFIKAMKSTTKVFSDAALGVIFDYYDYEDEPRVEAKDSDITYIYENNFTTFDPGSFEDIKLMTEAWTEYTKDELIEKFGEELRGTYDEDIFEAAKDKDQLAEWLLEEMETSGWEVWETDIGTYIVHDGFYGIIDKEEGHE